jgi:hypothetical protein
LEIEYEYERQKSYSILGDRHYISFVDWLTSNREVNINIISHRHQPTTLIMRRKVQEFLVAVGAHGYPKESAGIL